MEKMTTAQAILLALRVEEGSYTYQIVARSHLPSKRVSRMLSKMVQDDVIARAKDGNGAYLYFLKSSSPTPAAKHSVTILETKNIAAMWHRVAMLRRMRDKTIEEYHPLLNAVIRDYEIFLRTEENDD